MDQQSDARPWALLIYAGIWSAPVAAKVFFGIPLWPTVPIFAWCLAALVTLTWYVPKLRRIVYFPDSASPGRTVRVYASIIGMIAIGFINWFGIPDLDS